MGERGDDRGDGSHDIPSSSHSSSQVERERGREGAVHTDRSRIDNLQEIKAETKQC
jgi:hypothetical protein